MPALTTFLSQHKRTKLNRQTHTWFGSKATLTLSIPSTSTAKLWELLVEDAISTQVPSPDRCITEKVLRGYQFRFFADLDFNATDLGDWKNTQSEGDATFVRPLRKKLRSIVQLYHTVVCKATGTEDIEMIMTTRLPYKIHLHFPSVIVNTDNAKLIAQTFEQRLQDEHADIYKETVADVSVYTTGLRMLYCHKGSMANAAKREAEMKEHKRVFPTVPYCEVYYVTDTDTWTQNTVPSLVDVTRTSIHAGEDAQMTELTISGKGKGKRTRSRDPEIKDQRSDKVVCLSSKIGSPNFAAAASQLLLGFLINESDIAKDDIPDGNWEVRGTSLIIPTRSRVCPTAKREHKGNQQYFVVNRDGVEQRCHDELCNDSIRYPFHSELVKAAVADLFNAGKASSSGDAGEIIELPRTEDDRLSAFRDVIVEPIGTKTESAKLNLTTANERMTAMGYYMCTFPQNRYCPVCRTTHDRAENFMQISPLGHRGIGCHLRPGEFYPDPLSTIPAATINVLFNSTINLSVNTVDSKENRDFGNYSQFPRLYDDQEMNLRCFKSLNGSTYDVALFLAKMIRGKYVFQDRVWYRFTGKFWKVSGPHSFISEDLISVYQNLHQFYKGEKQTRWLNALINDLRNSHSRKAFIEDLEIYIKSYDTETPTLNSNPHLIGFQNGVFDARDCNFRPHRADDYLTMLLPYDSKESDPVIRKSILKMLEDMLPDEKVRDFVLLVLSLHLEGQNRHDIAMIWTGIGGNGKTVLKSLMKHTFGEFHKEPPATFLTNERPGSDRPCTDLVDLQYARSVFTSEPQAGKKTNSGFLKFITGRDSVRVRTVNSGTYVDFVPRFLVTLLCNAIPLFEGGEDDIRGIWRRVKIVHFGSVFTDNPDPTKPDEKQKDPLLEEKVTSWGPEFMTLLIERFRQYAANGRTLHVPEEVQNNLAEQKEENSPFDTWLTENLEVSPDSRVHYHRFEKAYNATIKGERGKISANTVRNQLRVRGFEGATAKGKDATCCPQSLRCVKGVTVKGWELLNL